jgi:hypothetical protein
MGRSQDDRQRASLYQDKVLWAYLSTAATDLGNSAITAIATTHNNFCISDS